MMVVMMIDDGCGDNVSIKVSSHSVSSLQLYIESKVNDRQNK